MNYKKMAVAVAAANLTALYATAAAAEVYSSRNFAMGGAGVASSEYDAASAANGALLTRFDKDDDIAWIIPALGAEVSDKDEVVDTLDEIPDIYDELEFNIDNGNNAAALENADAIISRLEAVSDSPVRVNSGALIGVAIPSKSLAVAVDLRTSVEAGAIAAYDPNDEAIILAAIVADDSSLLDNTRSSGFAIGAAVTDFAITLAREFTMGENNALSLSVTPKYQRVDTLIYAATVQDYDSNDFDENRNDDANFNIDLGASYAIGDSWMFGLRARNLVSEEYDTELITLGNQVFQSTYQVEPSATLGVAYNSGFLTATVEGDLVKNKGFEDLDETQFLRAGIEFNGWDWVQLRFGYRYDMEETREDIFTAGLGFSPWDVFHFDLAASYGNNDTYGAALDLRWTF